MAADRFASPFGYLRRVNRAVRLTAVEQIIAAYAGHLQKDQGLSGKTLMQYCPFAEAFLSERFGTGSIDLSVLRGLEASSSSSDRPPVSVGPGPRRRQSPCVPFSAMPAIAEGRSLIWPVRFRPWPIGR